MAGERSILIERGMPGDSKLFEHLNFLIVVTKSEQLTAAKGIADLLRAHSCQICSIFNSYDVDVADKDVKSWFAEEVTEGNLIHFIISEDCTFPFYQVAAFDFLIPVVNSGWIFECISTKRHVRTSPFSPDPRHIFKDFQIYVSRHSFNSSEYLFYTEAVHALGGTCVDFLSSRTTHLITKDCRDPGILAVLNYGKAEPMKFVYPTWVVQSLKQFIVAPVEVHHIDPGDTIESVKAKLDELWSVVNDMSFAEPTRIWENHRFIIGMDVSLSRDLYSTFIQFLESNGGGVHRHLDEADITKTKADCYIGKSVTSKEYEVAEEATLYLGNIIWIFYMWSFGSFLLPSTKLIFSPFKRRIFETNQLIMAYTNFFGQQRFYIQRLVNCLGGYTTSELSRKNTHLLCRFPFGKKYETAKKWDKCIITNHLWVEECYMQAQRLDPLKPEFQQIPVKGGLKTTLGQIQWNEPDQSQEEINSKKADDNRSDLPMTSQPNEKKDSTDSATKLVCENISNENLIEKPKGDITSQMQETVTMRSVSRGANCKETKSGFISTKSEVLEAEGKPTTKDLNEEQSPSDSHYQQAEVSANCGELVIPVQLADLEVASPSQGNKVGSPPGHDESHQQEQSSELSQKPKSEENIETVGINLKEGHNSNKEKEAEDCDNKQEAGIVHLKPDISKLRLLQTESALNNTPARKLLELSESQKKQNFISAEQQKALEKEQTTAAFPHIHYAERQYRNRDTSAETNNTNPYSETSTALSEEDSKLTNLNHAHETSNTNAPGTGQSSEQANEETQSKSETPTTTLSPASPENASSSQGSRRAAKAKAARKLHEDIEELNEFQRNSKRKRTGNLLPEEIAQLEKRKKLENQAKETLAKVLSEEHEIVHDHANTEKSQTPSQHTPRKRLPYHINAVHTGGHNDINELDLVLLRLIGITIHNDITNENIAKLNTVIAPKKLRTAKFLKSLSFHPLKYALTPTFLKDILRIIHKNKRADLQLDLSKYYIPDMDQEKLYKFTSLPTKVFERAGILTVNIANDIPGGIEVISSILKVHGVKETKAIPTTHMNKLSSQELLANHDENGIQGGGAAEYLFLATKASQVKSLKKLAKDLNKSILAVEWDWFVASMFQLNVNFNDRKHVIYWAT
ncbi:RTT107 (YHR154W) [Zygosaccharomyces parabailii]|nr:RTT107 (YHR154W) [Zygosaccharomyces parabailii]